MDGSASCSDGGGAMQKLVAERLGSCGWLSTKENTVAMPLAFREERRASIGNWHWYFRCNEVMGLDLEFLT